MCVQIRTVLGSNQDDPPLHHVSIEERNTDTMKFKLSRLFAFLAVLFLVSQARAQGTTLRGKITDTETMDGLPGANIEVIGPDGKATGSDNRFERRI